MNGVRKFGIESDTILTLAETSKIINSFSPHKGTCDDWFLSDKGNTLLFHFATLSTF